ncbi:hypothetical protein DFA_09267 [Cavenderia fasciculata]|uniref:Uncharacterized protein n=1 Tax=Cavenderia fasciculata TaxID=261658 RepID=F4Q755_CACFS|nr:uncharacterized protein DFA_09267 [Cavenderia fasciculata]EGG16237.1 hypothetical protein DFA_09267 [Cavenderia fasciculata]|eukprot:XP_004354621.1 hypothetical protein DFA_09267 [Cavenderia fasciculata]
MIIDTKVEIEALTRIITTIQQEQEQNGNVDASLEQTNALKQRVEDVFKVVHQQHQQHQQDTKNKNNKRIRANEQDTSAPPRIAKIVYTDFKSFIKPPVAAKIVYTQEEGLDHPYEDPDSDYEDDKSISYKPFRSVANALIAANCKVAKAILVVIEDGGYYLPDENSEDESLDEDDFDCWTITSHNTKYCLLRVRDWKTDTLLMDGRYRIKSHELIPNKKELDYYVEGLSKKKIFKLMANNQDNSYERYYRKPALVILEKSNVEKQKEEEEEEEEEEEVQPPQTLLTPEQAYQALVVRLHNILAIPNNDLLERDNQLLNEISKYLSGVDNVLLYAVEDILFNLLPRYQVISTNAFSPIIPKLFVNLFETPKTRLKDSQSLIAKIIEIYPLDVILLIPSKAFINEENISKSCLSIHILFDKIRQFRHAFGGWLKVDQELKLQTLITQFFYQLLPSFCPCDDESYLCSHYQTLGSILSFLRQFIFSNPDMFVPSVLESVKESLANGLETRNKIRIQLLASLYRLWESGDQFIEKPLQILLDRYWKRSDSRTVADNAMTLFRESIPLALIQYYRGNGQFGKLLSLNDLALKVYHLFECILRTITAPPEAVFVLSKASQEKVDHILQTCINMFSFCRQQGIPELSNALVRAFLACKWLSNHLVYSVPSIYVDFFHKLRTEFFNPNQQQQPLSSLPLDAQHYAMNFIYKLSDMLSPTFMFPDAKLECSECEGKRPNCLRWQSADDFIAFLRSDELTFELKANQKIRSHYTQYASKFGLDIQIIAPTGRSTVFTNKFTKTTPIIVNQKEITQVIEQFKQFLSPELHSQLILFSY